MMIPRTLAVFDDSIICPFTTTGHVRIRSGFLEKCISVVFSLSNVAPLRLSQYIALSTRS